MRNYDKEIVDNDRKYAYSFDFDIMHKYMIKTITPLFDENGKTLEMGCFKGDFTSRLVALSNDITCIEASKDAAKKAREVLPDSVNIINDTFENIKLDERFSNIIMTHVLEHLDDPVGVLKRVNDEWLTENGYFFLVCPNANAPSRQIAVRMGLISHNSAVTPAEDEHGHRITYSLDTLERDARLAGLEVVQRGGIFFKALANFQWDRILETDIINDDYLEGCYQLGQIYPDLCSSIYVICKKKS